MAFRTTKQADEWRFPPALSFEDMVAGVEPDASMRDFDTVMAEFDAVMAGAGIGIPDPDPACLMYCLFSCQHQHNHLVKNCKVMKVKGDSHTLESVYPNSDIIVTIPYECDDCKGSIKVHPKGYDLSQMTKIALKYGCNHWRFYRTSSCQLNVGHKFDFKKPDNVLAHIVSPDSKCVDCVAREAKKARGPSESTRGKTGSSSKAPEVKSGKGPAERTRSKTGSSSKAPSSGKTPPSKASSSNKAPSSSKTPTSSSKGKGSRS
ncbi:hypothetical protein MMC20_000084 [Loxospora ochrophaea]|nr:hypothetical protein [Loxospora ochrophaea]